MKLYEILKRIKRGFGSSTDVAATLLRRLLLNRCLPTFGPCYCKDSLRDFRFLL